MDVSDLENIISKIKYDAERNRSLETFINLLKTQISIVVLNKILSKYITDAEKVTAIKIMLPKISIMDPSEIRKIMAIFKVDNEKYNCLDILQKNINAIPTKTLKKILLSFKFDETKKKVLTLLENKIHIINNFELQNITDTFLISTAKYFCVITLLQNMNYPFNFMDLVPFFKIFNNEQKFNITKLLLSRHKIKRDTINQKQIMKYFKGDYVTQICNILEANEACNVDDDTDPYEETHESDDEWTDETIRTFRKGILTKHDNIINEINNIHSAPIEKETIYSPGSIDNITRYGCAMLATDMFNKKKK